jgi:UDP-glucuronate decarboxylase
MKIIVTGGAGFLGSHLCDFLISGGHTIFCLDNFSTGKQANIEHLLNHDRFNLIVQDIVDPFDLPVDQIYNLASAASPSKYQLQPIQTTKTNVIGAINCLNLATKYNARILQASTSEIYGDPTIVPQIESYNGNVNPIGPRSCYDEGKRCAESLFFDYRREHNVSIKVARIFNTYGPKMDPLDGRVVSNFIMQSLNNQNITVYGNGDQIRSFCYVDDLIDGLVKLMNSNDNITGPVNIGNPIETKILDLANLIISLTQSKSNVVFLDPTADDPKHRKPDISLATETLGFRPQIDLISGLHQTIQYFKNLQC